jgi:hypothetical protein
VVVQLQQLQHFGVLFLRAKDNTSHTFRDAKQQVNCFHRGLFFFNSLFSEFSNYLKRIRTLLDPETVK